MSTQIKLLYLTLAILLAWTFWPSEESSEHFAQATQITKVEDGNLLLFGGIKLGETTLKEAEKILASRSQRALFIMPPEKDEKGNELPPEHNIEAFIGNMPNNSKMLMGLEASDEQLKAIREKAHKPIAFPSGNIKLEVADEHQSMIDGMALLTITAIPRIRLSPEDITNKFGNPILVHPQDEILHFLYPELGLDAIIDQSGEAMLQFIRPDHYDLVLDKLGLTRQSLADASARMQAQQPEVVQ